jgi:hypothetical protein
VRFDVFEPVDWHAFEVTVEWFGHGGTPVSQGGAKSPKRWRGCDLPL